MKRWLPITLILLALIVLVSPGIIGQLAERAIEDQLSYAEERDPAFTVATASFERGWFTSAGQHRVALANPDLAGLVLALSGVAAVPGVTPVLVIDTRIDHGLVPVGAADRSLAELLPAIASGISTLRLEVSPGQEVAVPGTLQSRIGISGSAQFDYQLPAGSSTWQSKSASWSSAHARLTSSPDGHNLASQLQLRDLSIDTGAEQVALERVALDADAEMTAWGFAVGDFDLQLGPTSATVASGDQVGWSSLDIRLHSALQGEQMRGSLDADIADIITPNGYSDLRIRAEAGKLDAALFGSLVRLLNKAGSNQGGPSDKDRADLMLDTRRLLSAGADIKLEEVRVTTDTGELLARAEFTLPPGDKMQAWPSLLLALRGQADFELPHSMFAANAALGSQVQALIAAGFLLREGDLYRMNIVYAKGLATVNGVPMPLPLTGMQ